MILTTVMNKKHFVVLAFLVVALPMAAQQAKRAFTIEDYYRVRTASELDVSRDGSRFVFTVTSSNLPQAKRSTSIWIGETSGAAPRQLTRGEADKNGHFSPDGSTVAFLRDNNLWLLPLGG